MICFVVSKPKPTAIGETLRAIGRSSIAAGALAAPLGIAPREGIAPFSTGAHLTTLIVGANRLRVTSDWRCDLAGRHGEQLLVREANINFSWWLAHARL